MQPAKFKQHCSRSSKNNHEGKWAVFEAKSKMSQLVALQAVDWNEGKNRRTTSGLKGLKTIILLNMFNPVPLRQDKDTKKLWILEKEYTPSARPLE